MDKEYVVYQSKMRASKIKGELPDIVTTYLAGSIYNPRYTQNLDYALYFFNKDKAIETADLLCMQAGYIETVVRPLRS